MTEHYYSAHPTSASHPQQIEAVLRGNRLRFWVDRGTFSTRRVDFGTRLLIESLALPERGRFLDLGCGWGAIAVAVAKAFPRLQTYAVDVNGRAVALCRRNAQENGVEVTAAEGEGIAPFEAICFDSIATNPPVRAGKAVVFHLFAQAAAHLSPNGTLWVVMQKKQGAGSARATLQRLFQQVDEVAHKSGYHVYRCANPQTISACVP
ncbi:MAG: class I SAM-dependent methyltransferase [Firmicutes bacterium]|nr:class I SAM-dependent methyltransferase [Bacillota bacterium]